MDRDYGIRRHYSRFVLADLFLSAGCEQPEIVPFVNGAGYDTESYHSKDFYFLKGITRDTVYDLGDEKECLNVLL